MPKKKANEFDPESIVKFDHHYDTLTDEGFENVKAALVEFNKLLYDSSVPFFTNPRVNTRSIAKSIDCYGDESQHYYAMFRIYKQNPDKTVQVMYTVKDSIETEIVAFNYNFTVIDDLDTTLNYVIENLWRIK